MLKTTTYCDHCGEAFTPHQEGRHSKTYSNGYETKRFDLCTKCCNELNKIVKEFIKFKG